MAFTGTMLAAAAVGAGIASMQKVPNYPDPPKPTPPPQASAVPSGADQRTGVMGAGQSGGSPGIAQTMLAGPSGVDSSSLAIGKNTLLGGGG
jgi:hypothetical protein